MNGWLILLQVMIGLHAVEAVVLNILMIYSSIYLRIEDRRLRDAYDHEHFD